MTQTVPNTMVSFATQAKFTSDTTPATTAYVMALGVNTNSIKIINTGANFTLDNTYLGGLTVYQNSAVVLTLPLASTCPAGSVLVIECVISGAASTLSRQGSNDLIVVNNGTTATGLLIGNGDSITLVSDGSSVWRLISGSVLNGYAAATLGGQPNSYVDVTASRAVNTTYTNTFNKPIYLILQLGDTAAGALSTVSINGTIVSRSITASNGAAQHSVIIPPGATYSATTPSPLAANTKWMELR